MLTALIICVTFYVAIGLVCGFVAGTMRSDWEERSRARMSKWASRRASPLRFGYTWVFFWPFGFLGLFLDAVARGFVKLSKALFWLSEGLRHV